MASALLIDDDPARRAATRAILDGAGLTFELACRDDAEARARALRPHLALVALDLGGDEVPAICSGLREALAGLGAAIVLVVEGHPEAGGCTARRVEAALEAGADDVLALDEIPAVAARRVGRLLGFRQLAAMATLNEQLAQVGRLVAGIVHEIRSPLTVIRGNAELMMLELGPDHAADTWIRPIVRNARTLQDRLEHLMAAVRVGPAAPRLLDVVPLVRESISLFEKGVDSRRGRVAIELVLALDGRPIPPVLVDPGRLIQVVLNLLANAHEAILAGRAHGRIEVRVRDVPVRGEVEIVVHDDGPGIADGFLARVFEPFFTTKEKGTGYGLYLAAEILREHGGRLTACNHRDGGACFSIHLPAAPAA